MPSKKKKKKGGAGDARGYGQATTFKKTTPPAAASATSSSAASKKKKEDEDNNKPSEPQASADNTATEVVASYSPVSDKNDDENDATSVISSKNKQQPQDDPEQVWRQKIPPRVTATLPSSSSLQQPSKSKEGNQGSWLTVAVHEQLEQMVEEAMQQQRKDDLISPWLDQRLVGTNQSRSNSSQKHLQPPSIPLVLKKLASLYDWFQLLFLQNNNNNEWTQQDLQDAVSALVLQAAKQPSSLLSSYLSLEAALDYWVYHTTTWKLPPVLVESKVAQARPRPAEFLTSSATTVEDNENEGIKAQSAKDYKSEATNKTAAPTLTSPETTPTATSTSRNDAGVELQETNVGTERGLDGDEKKKDNATGAAAINTASTPEKTRQEEELEALELELAQVQRDCNDEASNYMRSKQEVKDLQRRNKQLSKQVQGMRRKVEAQRIKRQQEEEKEAQQAAVDAKDKVDDDDGAMGGFDLFGNDEEEDDMGEDKNLPKQVENDSEAGGADDAAFDLDLPEETIAKGWTGKSPKDLLEERCRKLQIPRPTFQKLGPSSCRVTIKINAVTTEAKDNNGDSESLIRLEYQGRYSMDKKKIVGVHNYLATQALYQMDPKLPIYNTLPPFFRDLWKSWLKKAEQEHTEAQQAQDKQREDDIIKLFSLTGLSVSNASSDREKEASLETTKKVTVSDSPSIIDANPDDEDENEEYNFDYIPLKVEKCPPIAPTAKQEAQSARLKQEFVARTAKQRYQSMLAQRLNLPIFAYREQILDMVSNNAVTILHAETGAGKTTQCPQFLLEEALNSGAGSQTSIICTQPRRVAATSVAERVAQEMDTKLGGQVGYSIRLEAKRSAETRLLFCTTGVILRNLIENPTLDGISHVVVDEVHERQWQIDVLLVALRNLIGPNGPRRNDLKVVLMSATLDAELFCSFFGGAPLVSVPGRTFPVSNYYLEDLIEATGHIVEEGSRNALREFYGSHRETASMFVTTKGGEKRRENVSLDSQVDVEVSDDFPDYSISTRKSLDRVDETVINYELIEEVLHFLLINPQVGDAGHSPLLTPDGKALRQGDGGAVLIIMPGIGEIRTLIDRLQSSKNFRDRRTFDIIPMHSALSSSEQRRAFVTPRKVKWAIIVATNILETSVTIPDAVCVLDSGRVREIRHDKRTLTRKLVTTWCSRASSKQRAGRAGRVRPGLCLRLFSSKTESKHMTATTEPELQRLPLEEVCLTILAGQLSSNGCLAFLMQTPQPPKQSAVEGALLSLVQVGAISMPTDESCEQLTALGSQLAKLPVDCRLGKMLLYSVWLRCVDRVATIVAALSVSQSLFVSTLRDANVAKAKQSIFWDDKSDFLTLVAVYEGYSKAKDPYSFCREHYMSYVALREISEARNHYQDLLRGWQRPNIDWNENNMDDNVLQAVLAAGLSPQVARIDRQPGGKTELWYRPTLFGTSNAVSQEQMVSLHDSSGLKLPKGSLPSRWLLFFEKFGVQHGGGSGKRLSVRTVAYVQPVTLSLVVGRDFSIRHQERRILIDGWMSLPIAAQSAVLLRAARELISRLAASESDTGTLKSLVDLLNKATAAQQK